MKVPLRRALDRVASAQSFSSRRVVGSASVVEFIAIESEIRAAVAALSLVLPDNLMKFGYKVYSQVDEDGILAEIFKRIGAVGRTFIEIGCGDGTENNTHLLALQGWRGAWIEGSADNVQNMREALPGRKRSLLVEHAFLTADNVNQVVGRLLGDVGAGKETLDLLSLDIDGNDLHILESLEVVRPRVICVEYNGKFPPPIDLTIGYDPGHRWSGDDYMGASLAALVRVLAPRGYVLVSCNVSGFNAFFVREDALSGIVVAPADVLYQPARPYLIYRRAGHPSSMHFLERATRVE